MTIHAVFIMNRAGQLIFQKNYTPSALSQTLDDFLQLAGQFHGIHLLSGTLSPTNKGSGLVQIDTEKMTLRCFQVATGTKFYLTADHNQSHLVALLRDIYEIYVDYVLKNPFYDLDQPISSSCDKFVTNLEELITQVNKGGVPYSVANAASSSSI